MRADYRLPGVYFLPASRPAAMELPPLDVAAFVGFAERGPLHVPVPLEDLSAYQSVFGGDFPLARDEGGRTVSANLAPSVAAFFGNGGRRCYVVRVAGQQARTARFQVPGMVALGAGGAARLASLSASSPGRWANALRLGTSLQITSLPMMPGSTQQPGSQAAAPIFQVMDDLHLLWQTTTAPQAIRVGDVLRLTFSDGQQWLFPVSEIVTETAGPQATLAATVTWHLVSEVSASPPLSVEQGFCLTSEEPVLFRDVDLALSGKDQGLSLTLSGPSVPAVQPGNVLLLRLSDGATYLFSVAEVRHPDPQASPGELEAIAREMLALDQGSGLAPVFLSSPPAALQSVERLRFDLVVMAGDKHLPTLGDLAFNAGHPRFWRDILLVESGFQPQASTGSAAPGTPTLTSRTEKPGMIGQPEISAGASASRQFAELLRGQRRDPAQDGDLNISALSGLLAPVAAEDGAEAAGYDGGPAMVYLPLDMALLASARTGPDQDRQGFDDLDTFDRAASAQLFLDGYLVPDPGRSPSAGALMATALDRYFVQNLQLQGMHSLMFVDEVALISVPDAGHRNWKRAAVEPPPALPAPPVTPPAPAAFKDCQQPPTISEVNPAHGSVDGGTEVRLKGSGFSMGDQLQVIFGGNPATEVSVLGCTTARCLTPPAGRPGPVTVEVITPNGTGAKAEAFTYEQAATEPEFPEMTAADDFDLDDSPLLSIQQALVRLCEARADVVGILTLPQHFDKRQCIGWQQGLHQALGLTGYGSGFSDNADLSYVAVYHPWLLLRDESSPDQLRSVSCDGTVCGMIAARERQRQVWVAPANLQLQGVLGLSPSFSTDDWADLNDLQFNLIRPEPRDFRAMSANTLSDERSLLQLSVRRLMILLRKAALDRGMDFAFESNHERFREGARVVLENMLRWMFERGAFAGPAPEASYRVVTDDSINTPQSLEQGRFIAQIQVAPSQPLKFMTVRLVRTGEGLLQATEA